MATKIVQPAENKNQQVAQKTYFKFVYNIKNKIQRFAQKLFNTPLIFCANRRAVCTRDGPPCVNRQSVQIFVWIFVYFAQINFYPEKLCKMHKACGRSDPVRCDRPSQHYCAIDFCEIGKR